MKEVIAILLPVILTACSRPDVTSCNPVGIWKTTITENTVSLCSAPGFQFPEDFSIAVDKGYMIVNQVPATPPAETFISNGSFSDCSLDLDTLITAYDGPYPIITIFYHREYQLVNTAGTSITGRVLVTVTANTDAIYGPGNELSCQYEGNVTGTLER